MSNSSFTGSSQECLLSQTFDYYNITDLPDSVEPTWTVFAVINGIAAPPTVLVNLLIIWTILENENLREISYNILLAILAVTDLLEGLIVEPLYCWYLVSLLLRRPIPCHFTVYSVPAMVCSCSTLNTLMVSSVDLYLAIEHPQFYRSNVTVKKVIIAIAIVWVTMLSSVLTGRVFAERSSDSLRKLPNASIGAINVLIILYCSARVQVTAYRQRRAIQAQVDAVQQVEQDEQRETRRQQYMCAVTTSMLVVASILFYCPCIITGIIQSTKGKDVTDDFKYISHPISVTFVHLQSLVNPIIMSLRLSYIRKGVMTKLLCRD